MELGFNHDRGTILNHLAETTKFLAKKLFSEENITEDQFSQMIKQSMEFFNEYQQCLILSLKKGE
jgi:hypothetical protein